MATETIYYLLRCTLYKNTNKNLFCKNFVKQNLAIFVDQEQENLNQENGSQHFLREIAEQSAEAAFLRTSAILQTKILKEEFLKRSASHEERPK